MPVIPLKIQIPQNWSAHEALTVVAFLEQFIDAIWSRHGDAMEQRYGHLEDLINRVSPVRYSVFSPLKPRAARNQEPL